MALYRNITCSLSKISEVHSLSRYIYASAFVGSQRKIHSTGPSLETQPSGTDIDEPDLSSDLVKSVLKLEEIDINLYRGTNLWKPPGGRGAYGGQVVGQALAAAGMTTPDEAHVHSVHCYFTRTGSIDTPILYHVDRVRNGRSFCTRLVKATQRGDTILTMQASYHKPEPEAPLVFQYKMPEAPPPEEVPTAEELLKQLLSLEALSLKRRGTILKLLAQEIPMSIKPLNPLAYLRMGEPPNDPRMLYWIRAKGHIGENDNLHQCVAAYLSDLTLLWSALQPFPKFRISMIASLDHCMWFHAPFRTDEWMLYECECSRSGKNFGEIMGGSKRGVHRVGGRSLTQGHLWRQDGVMAVTVAQEGIIRGHLPETNIADTQDT